MSGQVNFEFTQYSINARHLFTLINLNQIWTVHIFCFIINFQLEEKAECVPLDETNINNVDLDHLEMFDAMCNPVETLKSYTDEDALRKILLECKCLIIYT